MQLRNGTRYRVEDGPHWHPNVDITTLPVHMQWRPCPRCDRPRGPLSDPCYNRSKQEWSFMYATQEHYNYCREHYHDGDYAGYCHEHVEQASHYTWTCLDCNVVWWQHRFPINGVPNRYDDKELWACFNPIVGQPRTSREREYARRWRCKFSLTECHHFVHISESPYPGHASMSIVCSSSHSTMPIYTRIGQVQNIFARRRTLCIYIRASLPRLSSGVSSVDDRGR